MVFFFYQIPTTILIIYLLTDFQRTIIFGVTPNRRCVGIKIFPEPLQMDENENMSVELEDYIDRCVEQAIKLKQEVDCGLCAVEENKKIDLYPSAACVDPEYIIRSRVKRKNSSIFFLFIIYFI